MTRQTFDVTIIGAGLNGACLALSLAGSGLRVALIEAGVGAKAARPGFDDRSIALSFGSVRILSQLGLCQAIQQLAAPIKQIHVSDRGQFGFTRLYASDVGVDAFDQVVLARQLAMTIEERLVGQDSLTYLCPARLLGFRDQGTTVEIRLEWETGEVIFDTRLLVAADGTESVIRRQLGIAIQERHYGQHAIATSVAVDRRGDGIAYERFTDTGPLALLPLPNQRYGMVWTVRDDQLNDMLSLDDEEFLRQLQLRFGYRLGRFASPSQRLSYPLVLRQVEQHFQGRTLLIGNAAHSLHPVAGQGFNLGLRDVALLAELLREAAMKNDDPGAHDLLGAYVSGRKSDQLQWGSTTDFLVRLFGSPLTPVQWARSLGLVALDLFPYAKSLIASHAMGLQIRTAKLSSGTAR